MSFLQFTFRIPSLRFPHKTIFSGVSRLSKRHTVLNGSWVGKVKFRRNRTSCNLNKRRLSSADYSIIHLFACTHATVQAYHLGILAASSRSDARERPIMHAYAMLYHYPFVYRLDGCLARNCYIWLKTGCIYASSHILLQDWYTAWEHGVSCSSCVRMLSNSVSRHHLGPRSYFRMLTVNSASWWRSPIFSHFFERTTAVFCTYQWYAVCTRTKSSSRNNK